MQVQTALDGQWVNCRDGDWIGWIDWIQRKQKGLALERISVLKKLGELCLKRLDSPSRAVAAYESAGQGVPLCSEPLEKLISQMWPKRTVEAEHVLALGVVGAAHIRVDVLDALAEAQVELGDLRGAAETRLRAMLGMLITEKGDWNAHGASGQAEKFWRIASRLPTDKPLPPTLWPHVLDADRQAIEFPTPEDGPHGLPLSHPGPRLAIRPGHTAKTLTVSADMETPGGGGGSDVSRSLMGRLRPSAGCNGIRTIARGANGGQPPSKFPKALAS